MTILKNIKENRGRVTLASVLITSLMLTSLGLFTFINGAKADALSSVKDVLSTSTPSASANHTIFFTTSVGLAADETIIVDFNFDSATPIPAALNFEDIDLSFDTTPDAACDAGGGDTEMALLGAPAAASMGVVRTDLNTLTFTNGSTTIAANSEICIEVGTNAETGVTGIEQIVNSAGSGTPGTAAVDTVIISGTIGNDDTGTALVAFVEGVAVSVTVDASLSFTIAGVASGSCTEGGAATAVTTTVTTVPFGTSGLTTDTFYKGCQDITISTNASGGYSTSVQEDTSLLRTGADAGDKTIDDATCDSNDCTSVIAAGTTTAWGTAANNGGFGYTCSGSACNAAFATAAEFNAFPCQSAVAAECDPVNGPEAVQTPFSSTIAVATEVSRIVYKLTFSPIQPAGAYSNTVTYITTPTF